MVYFTIVMEKKEKRVNIWSLFIRIAVGVASFSFIYMKIRHHLNAENTEILASTFSRPSSIGLLALVFLMMPLNWAFESYKWQLITKPIQSISFSRAYAAVFTGICLGNLTPGRVGEFVGRMLYFKQEHRPAITLLHFVCGFFQLFITVAVGIPSLAFLWTIRGSGDLYGVAIGAFLFFAVMCWIYLKLNAVIAYVASRAWLKRFAIQAFSVEPQLKWRMILLSLCRYAVFSTQYFLLLKMIDIKGLGIEIFASIAVAFMMMSAIPMISFIEVAVRGAIAMLLFSPFGLNDLSLLCVSTLLWFVNIAVPSVLGYFLFLGVKTKKWW